jgi:Flp pilus assembly protein TadD
VLVALAAASALLSKPMAVTLPATLLLLDFWPLRRWPEKSWRALVVEKLPILALSLALSAITIVAQHSIGAANYGARFGLADRLGNALVSYVRYLGKLAWPQTLAPFYPHPGAWPAWTVGGAALLVVAVGVAAWCWRAHRPWLAFGWAWYLGTLVPAIGLVQVGAQAMADRYSYLPQLGLYTALAWGAAELAVARPRLRPALVAAFVVLLAAFAVRTWRQVPAWRGSVALYEQAIASGEDNATLRYLLAVAYAAAGRTEAEVAAQFRRAIEIRPDYINAHTQLASFALRRGDLAEARRRLDETFRHESRNPSVIKSLGSLAKIEGDVARARARFEEALLLQPNHVESHYELAQLDFQAQQLDSGRAHLEAILRTEPWNFGVTTELGILLANIGQRAESRRLLERALWINPAHAPARTNLRALDELERAK